MSRHARNRFGKAKVAWIPLAILALDSGCAARNEALERARYEYDRARQDLDTARYAPVALAEAGEALHKAERADSRDETTHLAYIANRKVNVARAIAQGKVAENETQRLLKEREKLLLDLRNRQVRDLQRELSDLKAQETERGLMITLGDVLFETAEANLKPGAQQKLYQLVTFFQTHPDRNVLIEGHTDSRGSESYNEDLSQRRAQAVQDFLIRNGVDLQRIIARGYGEAYPVASNDTSAGRLQNRRVEIYFSEAGKTVTERQR